MSEEEKELTDESQMPFGKYGPKQGDCRKLRDIPADYFLFLWEDGVWAQPHRAIHRYIVSVFSALVKDAKDQIIEHYPEGYTGPRQS